MLIKHKNNIIDIPKDEDEPSEEYNRRVIFIIKNMDIDSRYSFDDLIELSYIYKFKETLCCFYDEKTELIIKQLVDNLYIKF